MTISQSCSNQGSSRRWAGAWYRVLRAVERWQERRRARAELTRLAQVGDYLLRDVGLDPMLVRQQPAEVLERLTGRR